MDFPLIPPSLFAAEVRRRLASLPSRFWIDPGDALCGEAFRNYMLLEEWPFLLGGTTATLGSEVVFYNKYYWFLKLIRLWQGRHGHDAGMEQQAIKLLESSEQEGLTLDWTVIEYIEHRVGAEVKASGS